MNRGWPQQPSVLETMKLFGHSCALVSCLLRVTGQLKYKLRDDFVDVQVSFLI
jgi:hypothetical protein